MKKIALLPSLLTLGNAFCGFLAIAYTADALLFFPEGAEPILFRAKIESAAWLIFLAMIFDALDGKMARMTKLTSDFGGQLDSLCDAVSFGIAPAFLAKVLMDYETMAQGFKPHPNLFFLAAVLFVLCAVLRLARFNVENEHGEERHMYFKGLPTPAAAGVIVALILLYLGLGDSRITQLLSGFFPGLDTLDTKIGPKIVRVAIPFALPLLGLLMVSRVKYVHLFNYALKGRKSFPFLIQVLLILIVALVEPILGLTIFFFGYASSGPFLSLWNRVLGRDLVGEKEKEREVPVS